MRCLINFIGIQGLPGQNPESGEYINRLMPGLPLEAIVKVTEADQITVLEQWADIQNRASKRFNTRVISELQKRYQIRTIQRSIDLLKVVDKASVTPAAAKWRGGTIELTPDEDQRIVYSALQSIYIQEIKLYRTEATAEIPGAIFDTQTGEQLATFTVPAGTEAGWTRVKIEKRFSVNRVFFSIDATLVDGVQLDLTQATIDAYTSVANEFMGSGHYSRLRGAQSLTTSDEVTDDDLTYGMNTFGLSAVFSIQCSYEPLVCQNRGVFLLAWAYLLAWELLWTRINSSQINRWTIGIDRKNAEKLMSEIDTLFEEEMKTCFDGINLDLNDACLVCNAPYTYQQSLL